MATEEGRDSSTRDSSFFDPPEYEISYGEDHTLRWIPPAGSKELAVALSYHFPIGDLESKMRAATKKFLKAEAKGCAERARTKNIQSLEEIFPETSLRQQEGTDTPSLANPDLNKTPINVPTRPEHVTLQDSDYSTPGTSWKASPSQRERPQWLEIVSWKPEILGFKKKAPKRRYESEEREKVAANRGYACEEHRRRKMKCDPEKCVNNKHNFKKVPALRPSDAADISTDPGITSQLQIAANYHGLGREASLSLDNLSNCEKHHESPYFSEPGEVTNFLNSLRSMVGDSTTQPFIINMADNSRHPINTTETVGAEDRLEQYPGTETVSFDVSDQIPETTMSSIDLGVASLDPVDFHSSLFSSGFLNDNFGFGDEVQPHGEFGVPFSCLSSPVSDSVSSCRLELGNGLGERSVSLSSTMLEPHGFGQYGGNTKHDKRSEPKATPATVPAAATFGNSVSQDAWYRPLQDMFPGVAERGRVQNRMAQRKFRDKAREAKKRQDRDQNNQAHAGHSYESTDPPEIDNELPGLPWGTLSLKHILSRGRSSLKGSERGTRKDEDKNKHDDFQPSSLYLEGDRSWSAGQQGQPDLPRTTENARVTHDNGTVVDSATQINVDTVRKFNNNTAPSFSVPIDSHGNGNLFLNISPSGGTLPGQPSPTPRDVQARAPLPGSSSLHENESVAPSGSRERLQSRSQRSDYFGPTAAAGPFSEDHLVLPTSPGINSRGVPLTPQSPGDIAVPVEIDSRGIYYAVPHGKTDNVGQDLVHSDVDELARILQLVELP